MGRKETFEDFSQGVCRFLEGFAKKILLANNFALIADAAFSLHSDELSASFAWLGAVAYTLQIYFDFSGYSDMAIGLGKMFGFHFPENFNYPYISKSTSEFWRRWHISLGTWFRDYVYIPLGGSRVESSGRLIFNLFVVWSLTGFWHGASWTFICWGLLYFLSISLEKVTNFEKLGEGRLPAVAAKHLYTMLLVIFGWVLFRATTISGALSYLKTMLFLNGAQLLDGNTIVYLAENRLYLILGILFSMPVYKLILKLVGKKMRNGSPALTGAVMIVYPGSHAVSVLRFYVLYREGFLQSVNLLQFLVKGSPERRDDQCD
jgi:D-alanyl-lipoteichoic acid acyltransferase DltB (MBOAT superfamily)